MPSRRRLPPDPTRIVLAKSDEEFIAEYLPTGYSQWTHPATQTTLELRLVCARSAAPEHLDACFALVEHTSGAHYRGSSIGWNPAAKRREMRLAGMRYLLVLGPTGRSDGDDACGEGEGQRQRVCGFTSVMPVWEDGEPVLYCYELHLDDSLQGTGLGRHLLGLTLEMARRMRAIDRVVLTCFVANARALRFYARMGFKAVEGGEGEDEAEDARVLRGGRVVRVQRQRDHVVLGREVGADGEGEGES